MASNSSNGNGSQLLVVSNTGGITVIDPSTPLRRLNYFDGKFLRAADFEVEQGYLRHLVALSNQGLGPGVVYGYDTSLGGGDTVQIGPGLAIDPYGEVLLLQSSVAPSIQELIDATKKTVPQVPDASGKTGPGVFSDCIEIAAPPPTMVVPVSDIYVIAICSAEALCGQQDVYGVLCQDACVTSTDRPYRLDGIVVRAIPLQLVTPFPTSQTVSIGANLYLRSKVAHSWFADEVLKHPHAISRDGLLSTTWCLGAGYDSGCCEVPLAVVARAGATTIFLDAWIVRRERMEAPARRYWQWKMRMRPWDVFLAQILQFQCQLADVLSGIITPGSNACDPCAPEHQAINEAAQFIEQVRAGLVSYRDITANETLSNQPALLSLSLTQISDLQEKLQAVLKSASVPAQSKARILIQAGILELPSAGYLPVVNGTSVSVNAQVRALLGEGLDLRFCITTADYIAHAIEEAQHMDRISLLQGIDDPSNKPHVDILVPDGVVAPSTVKPSISLYAASLTSSEETGNPAYKGVAREEALCSGGTALYTAAAGQSKEAVLKLQTLARGLAEAEANTTTNTASSQAEPAPVQESRRITPPETDDGLWLAARTDQEIRSLGVNGQTAVSGRVVLSTKPNSPLAVELAFSGSLSISGVVPKPIGLVVTGTLNGILSLGLIEENQNQPTLEYLLTRHFNWPVELTYTGDDAIGSITLDLTLQEQGEVRLRLTRTVLGSSSSSQVTYQLALISASSDPLPLGELNLIADADVINPGNTHHKSADNGLDLIQTALTVSEPAFKPNAEALLFPAPPAPTQGLDIQAVRDWVAFTRRREKKCHLDVVPAPLPPPRSYRVLHVTADDVDQAKSEIARWTQLLKDPTELAKEIKKRLTEGHVNLIVKFAGGSATAQSDLNAAKADWDTFKPGSTIYYAAIGAVGESDATLQIKRLKTFENAISAKSKVDPAASKEATIIPYPPGAVPPDADGIMLLVTVAAPEQQHVFVVGGIIYEQIQNATNNLAALLANTTNTNLGLVTYTVSGSGTISVDDGKVKTPFLKAMEGAPFERSLMLSRKGDSVAIFNDRKSAATQIVMNLSGEDLTTSLTYTGTWPIENAPSILVFERNLSR